MRNVSNMGMLTDALIVAVIWQDDMKIRDYNMKGESREAESIVKEPHRKLINHSGSYAEF